MVPGMPLQEIATPYLQTYRSQHELCVLFLTCCARDSESNDRIRCKIMKKGHSTLETPRQMVNENCTCSGAPLLTRCIFPWPSIYVRAVRLSVGLNGRK